MDTIGPTQFFKRQSAFGIRIEVHVQDGKIHLGAHGVTLAKKPASKMTDKELVRRLFPKDVRKQLKAVVTELNREKPAGKPKKR